MDDAPGQNEARVTAPEERQRLLALARACVEAAAAGSPPPEPPVDGAAGREGGAFVTLRVASTGALRGCIGHFQGFGRMGETVARMARSAAVEDPRFPPVRPEEVDALSIEISLLSPMRKADPSDVVPGTHGIYIRSGYMAGTLLPQVAVEQGWDRETFLSHTCLKAGLPPDFWKTGSADVYVYTAEVFGENTGE